MFTKPERRFSTLTATFLVAGTSIGGGMLALPVATGSYGFLPSLLFMTLSYLAMTSSALLIAEVAIWSGPGSHMISMAKHFAGRLGEMIAWSLYLFIAYASLTAYTSGGAGQLSSFTSTYLGIDISHTVASLLFLLFFGSIIHLGGIAVGRINAILFTALILSYFFMIGIGSGHVIPSFLLESNSEGAYRTLPLFLTTFSFQALVPSLAPLVNYRADRLRLAIISGTTLTFLIYFAWQMIVLGTIPREGDMSLATALEHGEPATNYLKHHLSSPLLCNLAEAFAFFAIVTSFLGIALGLFDFLADGLGIARRKGGALLLSSLILIPSFYFVSIFERVFITALDSSGGYGDTILNGFLPITMVLVGRYQRRLHPHFALITHPAVLALLAFFFFTVITIEISHTSL